MKDIIKRDKLGVRYIRMKKKYVYIKNEPEVY